MNGGEVRPLIGGMLSGASLFVYGITLGMSNQTTYENGKGRKPDYRVGVKTRQSASKSGQGTIGAAWKEDDGTISIVLNPCVVLRFEDDVVIRLFPNDYVPRASKRSLSGFIGLVKCDACVGVGQTDGCSCIYCFGTGKREKQFTLEDLHTALNDLSIEHARR